MEIKYEIHKLENVHGEGNRKNYVSLRTQKPMDEEHIAEVVEANSTLKKGDIKAVFTEFRQIVINQLQQAGRAYLPGIGWLSVKAGLSPKAQQSGYKITGKDISMQAIRLRTEKRFYDEVAEDITFAKSNYSTKSVKYTEEELWAKIDSYLTQHRFITCPAMQSQFGLSKQMANKWLSLLVAEGKLIREQTKQFIIYFINK